MKRLLMCLCVLLLGCSEFEFEIETPEGLQHWDIVKIEGPTESRLNQELTLRVIYPRSSGCDIVSELVSDRNGTAIYVKAFGYTVTDSPCTLAAVPGTINFTFVPDKRGRYVFKFINRDRSVISHTAKIF